MSDAAITIPDIDKLQRRPFVQALASRDSWVRIDFYKDETVTKEEIYRAIEILCMIYNGWS